MILTPFQSLAISVAVILFAILSMLLVARDFLSAYISSRILSDSDTPAKFFAVLIFLFVGFVIFLIYQTSSEMLLCVVFSLIGLLLRGVIRRKSFA